MLFTSWQIEECFEGRQCEEEKQNVGESVVNIPSENVQTNDTWPGFLFVPNKPLIIQSLSLFNHISGT